MKSLSKLSAACFFLLITFLFSACTQRQRVTVLIHEPVCEEAIAEDLAMVSDRDISALLDQSIVGEEVETCWEPLMEKALDHKRDIPQKHLVIAVKRFNNRAQQNLFKKSTLAYLNKIADAGVYTRKDRKLLEGFSSMTINNAASNNDSTLKQTRLVCNRLDPKLYTKIFK